MNVLVNFSPVISNSCRSYVLGVILKVLIQRPNFVRGESSSIQNEVGVVKTPPANTKYVNCYNFWWDSSISIYLVCLDSQWRPTSYINVYVSHKTNNGVRNGAFSQNYGGWSNILLRSFQIDAKSLNMRISLKIRFYRTIWVQGENIQIQNEAWGLKTPHRPLCKIYRLLILLMRWSDLNVFRKYWFRIRGCSLKVEIFKTILQGVMGKHWDDK